MTHKMTPEGKIKLAVKELLKPYQLAGSLYANWPVPGGYGSSTLDALLCFRGHFAGIETKAPGKRPTARQQLDIDMIRAAGGTVFVIDGVAGIEELRQWLLSEASDQDAGG